MNRLGAAVIVLALVSGRVEAQDARLSRLDRRVQTEVAALVDTARSLGIPSEPVVDKALEGAAKRAPNDRIIIVVRSRFRELVAARAALGGGAMDAEIIAAADALHAGASPQVITALRTRRPGAPLTDSAGGPRRLDRARSSGRYGIPGGARAGDEARNRCRVRRDARRH